MKEKIKIVLSALLIVLIVMLTVLCIEIPKEENLFGTNVKYSAFGARGDGKTDDFLAIKKAHEYANEHGVAVKADKGARYYIGAVEDTIPVKTNVDWRGAEFIIDDKSADTDSKVWWYPLFKVLPDKPAVSVELPRDYTLSAGQKNVNLSFQENVMLAVYNDHKKDFIRYGANNDQGAPRQEIILVDKNGNVDASTPLQWDYTQVTKMMAYSIGDQPITLYGGKFTTIANDDPQCLNYFERGIRVERANTVVKHVQHYVTGEGKTGSPYNGFFRTNFANNVVFENCMMTGHKLYKNASGNDQGTYDTRLASSNQVHYKNCVQTNDHTDPAYWGVMCSDYCKNLYMTNCKLSRFDAHKGVYNATITNCDIGQHVSVTGGGTLRLENVLRRCEKNSTYFNRFITLRGDYGSTFDGDVIIKDSTLLTSKGINYVICADWYNWDFGYSSVFPKTITLDNVKIQYQDDITGYIHPHLYIYSHITQKDGETVEFAMSSKNPPKLTQKVIIKNNHTNFKITANTLGWFEDTVIVNK